MHNLSSYYAEYSLHLSFIIFLGFQLPGISLCTLNCTSLSARVLSSHSICTLNFLSFITFIIWTWYYPRHLTPSIPGYSKFISIVRPFILSIFGGSVYCFSNHRSISPISSRRFNSSFPSILNWPLSSTVIFSFFNVIRDIVPTFFRVGNVGALIDSSVGKIIVFSWGITLSTKWSNSSREVNYRLLSYQVWWASSIPNPKYLMSVCSWINKNSWC